MLLAFAAALMLLLSAVADPVLAATGAEVTSTPTNGYYQNNDTITFKVTFSGTVTVTGQPQFAFDLGGETRYATYTSGTGSSELLFSYLVASFGPTLISTDPDDHDGISWGAGEVELNGGTIQTTSPVADANLNVRAQAALSNHKVNARAPMLPESPPDGIIVNGTTITLEYNEPLDTASVPVYSDFSAKKTPTGVTETDLTFSSTVVPVVSGDTVTLTLDAASSVSATDIDVKLSYLAAAGVANQIKDANGRHARPFTDRPVYNVLGDNVAPVRDTNPPVLAADGLTLTITYNEALNTNSVPADDAFTVMATPAGGIPTEVDLVGTRPILASARVNATTLRLEFSEPLDTTSVPANSAFSGTKTVHTIVNRLQVQTVTDLAFSNTAPTISGSTVTLTLAASSSVVAADTDVKITYTKPSTNPIKDLSGKEADTFSNRDVVDTPATLVSARVNATTLTLEFSEALDTTSVPANSAFSGTKTVGTTVSVLAFSSTAPTISGSTLTLTLAVPVSAATADVKIAYTKQVSLDNRLKYLNGKEVDTFSNRDVVNVLGDPVDPVTPTGSRADVSISGRTVVLTMANPIAHNDTSVTVAFAKGDGPAIEDLAGNDAANFGPLSVTNNSTIPRIGIVAVHPDASAVIAHARFNFTSSYGSTPLDVDVDVSVVEGDIYVTDTSLIYEFRDPGVLDDLVDNIVYGGNTSGNLTYRIEPHSSYAVALAPNNEVTVMVKAPTSGFPVQVEFPDQDVRVAEGEAVDVPVTFTLAAGLAAPRDSFTINVRTADESAEGDYDFEAILCCGLAFGPDASDWTEERPGRPTYRSRPPKTPRSRVMRRST